ncbi:MAG: repeat containing protein, partial [Cyanobacteria bacterium RYN_339]|nr:repeat containing protein [Cyanobacteria bacterium RYN_339]
GAQPQLAQGYKGNMVRRTSTTRVCLTLALLAGCSNGPTGTTPRKVDPKAPAPTAAASLAPVVARPSATDAANPTPVPSLVAAPASLAGVVRAPASLVANNGGSYRTLALAEQVPVAGATVRLLDAAGQPVLVDGVPLATRSAADGSYAFNAALPARNLVLEVTLPAGKGLVQAIAPRGVTLADADLVSTLSTGYILDQYVKGDAKVLEKLPADVEAATRARTRTAFEAAAAAVPDALTTQRVVAAVEALRKQDHGLDDQLEAVRKLLVVGSATAAVTDGDALAAQLSDPNGLALDAAGNLYIADTGNYLIRKLQPDGRITTIAGSGELGDQDGPALQAKLHRPTCLALDAAGNLYIADDTNLKLKKLTPAGLVSTLAGSGKEGAADGLGAAASFGAFRALAAKPDGTLYVLDQREIRQVAPDGSVTTLHPVGVTGATALALAPDGTLYANVVGADAEVARITPGGAVTRTPLTGDPFFAYQLAFDPTGFLVGGHWTDLARIAAGGKATALAGSTPGFADGPGAQARFAEVAQCVVGPKGEVYVADHLNQRVRKIAPDGTVTTVAGSGVARSQNGSGGEALFGHFYFVAATAAGEVLVADTYNHRIRKIAANGQVSFLAGTGVEGQQDGAADRASFRSPAGILAGPDGSIWVSEPGAIRRIGADGLVSTLATDANLPSPFGMALDADGSLLVAQGDGNTPPSLPSLIVRVTQAGAVTVVAGNPRGGAFADGPVATATFAQPHDVAVGPDGAYYVADTNNHRIRKIAGGQVSTYAGATQSGDQDGPLAAARFDKPWGVTFDKAGALYVSEIGKNRIRRIDPAGTVSTLAIAGLNLPFDVSFLPDGRMAIADGGNRQVKIVTP